MVGHWSNSKSLVLVLWKHNDWLWDEEMRCEGGFIIYTLVLYNVTSYLILMFVNLVFNNDKLWIISAIIHGELICSL